MASDDLIEIGFIREAHGLRGQVVVHAFSGREDLLTQYGALLNADGSRTFSFEIINAKGNDFLCKLDGVTDRDDAEKLRGTKLFTKAANLPPPEAEDEYYIRDLIGLTVKDQNGTTLGVVKDVWDLGVQSAFDIEFTHNGETALAQAQRELLLYTKQNVLALDNQAKTMTIDLPLGLLDDVKKDAD